MHEIKEDLTRRSSLIKNFALDKEGYIKLVAVRLYIYFRAERNNEVFRRVCNL
jgi:hypothetical protein